MSPRPRHGRCTSPKTGLTATASLRVALEDACGVVARRPLNSICWTRASAAVAPGGLLCHARSQSLIEKPDGRRPMLREHVAGVRPVSSSNRSPMRGRRRCDRGGSCGSRCAARTTRPASTSCPRRTRRAAAPSARSSSPLLVRVVQRASAAARSSASRATAQPAADRAPLRSSSARTTGVSASSGSSSFGSTPATLLEDRLAGARERRIAELARRSARRAPAPGFLRCRT